MVQTETTLVRCLLNDEHKLNCCSVCKDTRDRAKWTETSANRDNISALSAEWWTETKLLFCMQGHKRYSQMNRNFISKVSCLQRWKFIEPLGAGFKCQLYVLTAWMFQIQHDHLNCYPVNTEISMWHAGPFGSTV